MSSESDSEISRNKEMIERCVHITVLCVIADSIVRVISVLPSTVDGLYIQGLEETEKLEQLKEHNEEEEDRMNDS